NVSSDAMRKLPTLRRNAAALLTLQPGVSPGTGTFPRVGMRVAGAVDDQNTFTLDGIDVSDNVIGGLDSTNIAVILLSVEAVDEFRVGVNNPNATFGRASGGQIAVVSKRGTNNFHGAGYWVHQNDFLNANLWEFNRINKSRPTIRDNRFGGRVGGPSWHNKTFFFFNYEGRRFPQQSTFTRLMPSNQLRQGILKFKDAAGNTVAYNLARSTLRGSGSTAADPRGLAVRPSLQLPSMYPRRADGPRRGYRGVDGADHAAPAQHVPVRMGEGASVFQPSGAFGRGGAGEDRRNGLVGGRDCDGAGTGADEPCGCAN